MSPLQKKRGKNSREKEGRDEFLKIWAHLEDLSFFFFLFLIHEHLQKPFGERRKKKSETAHEALPYAGLNGNTQSDHNSGCNSSHTFCLSVDSQGCIKAWRGRGLGGDNPNFSVIHKPLLCNLDNRSLFSSDSLSCRANRSSCSLSPFRLCISKEGQDPHRRKYVEQKIRKTPFFFSLGEADFLLKVGDGGGE